MEEWRGVRAMFHVKRGTVFGPRIPMVVFACAGFKEIRNPSIMVLERKVSYVGGPAAPSAGFLPPPCFAASFRERAPSARPPGYDTVFRK